MKVAIIYFSQTGNTRRVAETMAGTFRESGHPAWTISLEKATPQDAITGDLLGIGTPTFSSQAPTPVRAFLSTLPPLDRQRAFVFATTGGAPGRVLSDLAHLLRSKGASVVGGFLVRGEVHHPAPCLIGRYPNRPDANDLAKVSGFAAAVARHAGADHPGMVPESRTDLCRPKGGFYDRVASFSSDAFLRLTLPEPRLDPVRCDQCGACVDECPMHNISLQPYPVLGRACIRCYHCLTGCPKKAFDADWRLGNLAVLALYNKQYVRWFGDLKHGERMYAQDGR